MKDDLPGLSHTLPILHLENECTGLNSFPHNKNTEGKTCVKN